MKVIKVNYKNIDIENKKKTEEMAYQLRVLAAIAEGWSLSPRIHTLTASCNSSSDTFAWHWQAPTWTLTHEHTDKCTYISKNKKEIFKKQRFGRMDMRC